MRRGAVPRGGGTALDVTAPLVYPAWAHRGSTRRIAELLRKEPELRDRIVHPAVFYWPSLR